jgi:pyruvate formate lyase activating enzyme
MKIAGFVRTTLLDFPGSVASIIFLDRCNFRCGFCHNPELVTHINPENFFEEEQIFEMLEQRKNLVDAVVVSGGEPCLHSGLFDLISKLKKKGFKVKLDTNGSMPKVLEKLYDAKLLDFVAMDIKANLTQEAYERACGVHVDVSKIKESIEMIKNSEVPYEFRTTIFPKIISKEGFYNLVEHLKGSKKYVLQQLVNSENMLDDKYMNSKIYEPDELRDFKNKIVDYFDEVEIRGI